ncbi:MAG: hypothetical protein M3Z05_15745 [Gemmatimonadota bacterium]|nr:hypothetical protein [Gemmatimonadota bacterium]
MASRSFEDSLGILWEVFEVRRASEAPRGVSNGLEKGWLTFVSADVKRRLAPFPTEWQQIPALELERLCTTARVVNPPRLSAGASRPESTPATRREEPLAEAASPMQAAAVDDHESLVRDVVRMFAHEARRNSTPAIEAMVRLKGVLAERYSGAEVDASTRADLTDLRRIRRWFVEAYYFERPA